MQSPNQTDANEDSQPQPSKMEQLKESNGTAQIIDDSKTLSNDSDTEAMKTSKNDEDQSETSNSQDKTLKKPDKILPCPRCNSMDTKFCYFNNYNVNQPRHFCKNCQRYWTAGGTMRNVPVGAGRRKNKNPASQFRPLSLPEALPNGIHVNPNGTVLTFSSDTSLSESMASALNIAENTIRNGSRNGLQRPDELQISVSHSSKENREDRSSGSSVTASCSKDEMRKPELVPNCQPFPQAVPCFPGGPWPYPWNWSGPMSPPTLGPANFPVPFYPPGGPYWACAPGSWAVPWVIPPTPAPLNGQAPPPSSGPNSPTLGKHSREDSNIPKPEERRVGNSEKYLWVPKTLRIDDPGEAAKSSIWETLGIKNERADSVGGRGIFKVFSSQSKGDEKTHVPETSTILQANPAALSRSNNFHESS